MRMVEERLSVGLLVIVAVLVGALAIARAIEDPLLPSKALEIAKAQRDYVIAKGSFERAAQSLQSLTAEANDLCKKAGLGYDGDKIACVQLPATDKPTTGEK